MESKLSFIDYAQASIDIGRAILTGNLSTELSKRPIIVKHFLETYGNMIITKIVVIREPIRPVIEWFARQLIISKEKVDELGFDKIFHLSANFYCNNGTRIMIEKNERVNIDIYGAEEKGDTFLVPNLNISFNELFDKSERVYGGARLYHYDPRSCNCQRFILDLIITAGGYSELLHNFVLQNTLSLISIENSKSARIITNIAGVFNYIQHGGCNKQSDADE